MLWNFMINLEAIDAVKVGYAIWWRYDDRFN
jgi:hypothetical protein